MWKEFLVIYLSSFRLSNEQVKNPNIYPYHVFRGKDIEPFVFSPITVLYGNNGSGKSTILNIMANKLMVKGREYATSNSFGIVDYCGKFSAECCFSYGEDEFGNTIRKIPENSRFIKSEDILYEIKKIQQKQILADGMEYDYMKNGHSRKEAEEYFQTREGRRQLEYITFAQEKYSNGETAMQFFEDYLLPDALYLLDEPGCHCRLRIRYCWQKKLIKWRDSSPASLLLPHIHRLCLERWMQRFII